MKKKPLFKRILAASLAVAVTVNSLTFASLADDSGSLEFAEVSNNRVSVKPPSEKKLDVENDESSYLDTDVVRVSIVLKDKSTIENAVDMGQDIENIADNPVAVSYRNALEDKQSTVADKIESAIGEELDVVWNLTLAANIISANVEYSKIAEIEKLNEVEEVLIETQYFPCKVDQDLPLDPQMATSGYQIGSVTAWAEGYTGAGSRIAIIDTGTDDDHQSFSEAGYLHALEKLAEENGKTLDAYKSELKLLTMDEINSVKDQLNAGKKYKNQSSVQPIDNRAYLNAKLPFAYNYVDGDYQINHDNDGQGEHGSHVAGIATANRYIKVGEEFFAALEYESAQTQGVAPDAQLITMKVFGKNGGAYDSDYMVAIEDAIVLKADSINLSLGSSNPGATKSAVDKYQAIMDDLTKSGVVVSISAGNAGYWAENTDTGLLYSDDVSMDTVGSPGSYTNSLSVASIDNVGKTAGYVQVGSHSMFYNENPDTYKSLMTLGGEQEFVIIKGYGSNEEWAALGNALEGRIAVCSRGELSFVEKANNAVENGAIATIIYNNQPGTISMSADGYKYDKPYVSMTMADGDTLWKYAEQKGEAITSNGKTLGYIASMTVSSGVGSVINLTPEGYLAPSPMSSFSSWGVPGSLELKPEITAPGGNIYSVNGAIPGGTSYENMSGTSMAAPQVAGMSALMAQYIRENNLTAKTGKSARVLTQSLLMSTADPVATQDGSYYPVIQQGAGLANVAYAITAESYLMMEADATDSYADGKIKAELGDDPDKKGEYSFSYTINNLTNTAKDYELYTDLFTQAPITDGKNLYLDTSTTPLEAEVVYTVNGATYHNDDVVTVPANGSIKVSVTIKLDSSYMKELMTVFDKGAYIEGYSYATGCVYEDGEVVGYSTYHTIPILGFYGSWTDPSMFDVGSYYERISGEETRSPYLGEINNIIGVTYADEPGETYILGGNPIFDEEYKEERNAVNSSTVLSAVEFAPIRNAASSRLSIINNTDPSKSYYNEYGSVSGAYYRSSGGAWMNTDYTLSPDLSFGSLGFKNNEKVTVSFSLAPEYYLTESEDGAETEWDKLGEGASFEVPLTIDDTKPIIKKIVFDKNDNAIKVTASDNQYIAGLVLFNKHGDVILSSAGSDPDTNAGDTTEFVIPCDNIKGSSFLIQAFDYAYNITTYAFNANIGEDIQLPGMLAINGTYWYDINLDKLTLSRYAATAKDFVAATIADHYIFAVDGNNDLYVMHEDEIFNYTKVRNLGVSVYDMAYNPVDKQIYGVADYTDSIKLVRIDKLNGEVTEIADVPDTMSLACDKNGVFYSGLYGTGAVYTYTLDTLKKEKEDDRFMVLFDLTEKIGKAAGSQGMEINPNTGNLCWTYRTVAGTAYKYGYLEFAFDGEKITIDKSLTLPAQFFALVIPDKTEQKNYDFNGDGAVDNLDATMLLNYRVGKVSESDISNKQNIDVDENGIFDSHDAYVLLNTILWHKPTNQVQSVSISTDSAVLLTNDSRQLSATTAPWTLTNRDIIWSSSDESVATVDTNGVVTAHKPGKCSITATSYVDASKSSSCEVTVETVNVTLSGALQDTDGKPSFYEWNPETSETWQPTVSITGLGSDMVSAAIDEKNNIVYISDNDEMLNKVDPKTGETLDSSNPGFAFGDMTYSPVSSTADTPMFASIEGSWLFPPKALFDGFDGRGYNLSAYLASYGASSFVALTSLGASEWNSDGEILSGEEFILIDNAGNVWDLLLHEKGATWKYYSVLPVNFLGGNKAGEYCSLSAGTDGNLYLSVYDGFTSDFYQIRQNEKGGFEASYFGNAGDNVWPVSVISASGNAPRTASYNENRKMITESVSVNELAVFEGDEASAESYETETAETVLSSDSMVGTVLSVPEMPAVYSDDNDTAPDDSESTPSAKATINNESAVVTLINNTDTILTNGLSVIRYNPNALKFNGTYKSDNGVYNAVNVDEEKGVIIMAYASSASAVAEDEPIQAVSFMVIDKSAAQQSGFQVSKVETNDNNKLSVSEKPENKPDSLDPSTIEDLLENVKNELIEKGEVDEEEIEKEYGSESVKPEDAPNPDPGPTPIVPPSGSGIGWSIPTYNPSTEDVMDEYVEKESGVKISALRSVLTGNGGKTLYVNVELTSKSLTYDIKLLDANGNSVQPAGEVTLTLPIPSDLRGKTIKDGKIRHILADGTTELLDIQNIKTYKTDGFVTVVTKSLSPFTMAFVSSTLESEDETADVSADAAADETAGDAADEATDISAETSADVSGNTNAPEDKNTSTGVILFVAPAAVSALAVLVAKKRRK